MWSKGSKTTFFYIIQNCKLLYLIWNKSTRNWQQKRKPQQKRKVQRAQAKKLNLPLKARNQHLVDMLSTLQDAQKLWSKSLVTNQLPQVKWPKKFGCLLNQTIFLTDRNKWLTNIPLAPFLYFNYFFVNLINYR